jgi:TolA-binding protein
MSGQAQGIMEMMDKFKINNSLRNAVTNERHREIHIKNVNAGAQKGNAASSGGSNGNGSSRQATAAGRIMVSPQGNMKSTLREDGFEEF